MRRQVARGALCPMCSTGMTRQTVGMVCQLCGTDYARPEQTSKAALAEALAVRAERDALAAKVERVRALHRPAYNDATRTPICETCHGKEGVHECGCWSAEDYQPVCAVCNEGHKGVSVPWPCPTIRALDGGE